MQKQRENKMGVMPVKQLIISMSLPMMISMLVQALYNVVDSMFVARLSEDALTAVTLAFPMQNALISFASGTGVGINALLSRSLGEKNFDQADRAANTGILLAVITFAAFALSAAVFCSSGMASLYSFAESSFGHVLRKRFMSLIASAGSASR